MANGYELVHSREYDQELVNVTTDIKTADDFVRGVHLIISRDPNKGRHSKHCPDCGAMVVAGSPHPDMCQKCIDRRHPAFDP
ncbi:MAG: hypothetical protein WC196_02780 [Bacilli bacterium]